MNKRIKKKKGKITQNELWGLEFTLAKYILPRLKKFRQVNKYSYPCSLNSVEEWNEVINKMIFSFDFILNEKDYDINEVQEAIDKYEEGMNLFAKYFVDLWI